VIAACALGEVRSRLIGKLSRGYRQRVAIAQALLNDPEVLILDEPTVGLDPRQTIEIRSLLRTLGGERTLLLSTHILSEVSLLCGRVIIIDGGRIVAENTAAGLARRVEGVTRTFVRAEGPPEAVAAALGGMRGVDQVERAVTASGSGTAFVVSSGDGEAAGPELAARIVREGWALLEIRPLEPSLEELFVAILGAEGGRTGDA
jgi:ABC-2 type transport system ATP-binding protein